MNLKPLNLEELKQKDIEDIMQRSMEDISAIYDDMRKIVQDVRIRGDLSLLDSSKEFKEDVTIDDLEVTREETDLAYKSLKPELVKSLEKAAQNIAKFHKAQLKTEMWSIEVGDGILAGRITRPMDSVGCYIPGGLAAYPSTTLMTIIPAKIAGVKEVVATTPAGKGMAVSPATLVAADIAGCDRVFKAGGPWGIAAMAYGTGIIPRVDKIVGPGNKYVTAAKMIVYGQVDIDSPAGPSEALIIADESADARLIAADFLAQVEHDPVSAAVLVTTSEELANSVCDIINGEYDSLPRKDILESSLKKHSCVLMTKNIDKAIEFTNDYAPEHLQILTEDPFTTLERINHAGSIFLGPYSPVPAGDYASGTNHVLPTGRCARMFSGLSVDDFLTRPTFQQLTREGLESIRDTVVTLAEAEGLPLHARAINVRFKE